MSDAAYSRGEKGTARLLVHLDIVGRLAVEEPLPAAERLQEALGPELAHTLMFALASQRRRAIEIAAA